MSNALRKFRAALASAALTCLLSSGSAARAGIVYGITGPSDAGTQALVRFDSANPGGVTTIGTLNTPGQVALAIDFRPSDGRLYLGAGGVMAQAYTVNLNTAALTPVGPAFDPTDPEFGTPSFDFNPVVDRLRVVTSANSANTRTNSRSDPDTGALVGIDTDIAFAAGDPGAGTANTEVAGIAYTNNVAGATSTTLYGYELRTDTIVRIGGPGGDPSPNNGQLTTIGGSGIVSPGDLGFDVADTGEAFISTPLQDDPEQRARLFGVNLATGDLDEIGVIGTPLGGGRVIDIAVAPSGPAAVPLPGAAAMFPLAAAVAGFAAWRARRRTLQA